MGKRLSDNISSSYIAAANSLKPQNSRKKIVAYVESYDDIFFWRTLFSKYEDHTRYFEVMLPSQTNLSKGKKSVLMNSLGSNLGEYMVACVDSDYDYLLQGATQTSKNINENKYIFQTYAYAIENYHCYAESLHEVCVMATLNDKHVIDFAAYLEEYSKIAYPLFIWSVWFYRKHILNEFSLMTFCSFVRLEQISIQHPERSLNSMSKKVMHKLRELEHFHPEALDEIEKMKSEFKELGVYPENTYLFIQGHHIMDNVIMKLLIPVCNMLRNEREQEIMHLAEHQLQLNNELTSYRRSQSDIDVVLKRHTTYKNCELYKRMEQDVERFLNELN